jgi:hypothetical protein
MLLMNNLPVFANMPEFKNKLHEMAAKTLYRKVVAPSHRLIFLAAKTL